MTLIMSAASPTTIVTHYHKTPRSSTTLVRCLWHKLAILAASNAPAVQSRTSLIVGTTKNASRQGWVSAGRNLFLPDMWFKPD